MKIKQKNKNIFSQIQYLITFTLHLDSGMLTSSDYMTLQSFGWSQFQRNNKLSARTAPSTANVSASRKNNVWQMIDESLEDQNNNGENKAE